MRGTKYFCKKAPSWMFDRALNPLMCINCLINGKKYILRLGKLIDNEDKDMRSAKNWHP